jgi:hypothetical protein
MPISKTLFTIFFLLLTASGTCQAQFLDSFNKNKIDNWLFFTGDGAATMDFIQKTDYARITVDATNDRHNVWWAIIKRDVSSYLDLAKLDSSDFELRVEARVRVSHAPRRINFMINTQRTTNFHEHLMEFDIPDTDGWHTISMTTKNFDAGPDDTVYVQLSVTDWGPGKYYVDVDYYRADIVNIHGAEPDAGEPLPYHPPTPPLTTFSNHLNVSYDGLINLDYPDVNFGNWHIKSKNGGIRILTVNTNQWAILRWDFAQYKNLKAEGPGLLELTTHSVLKGGRYIETFGEDLGMEFDKIRIIEIFGGDPEWRPDNVTFDNFIRDSSYSDIFNSQMIFDAQVADESGHKNFITISRPVMQRLLSGETKGLLIRPLGALTASFYAAEKQNIGRAPKLHFNTAAD